MLLDTIIREKRSRTQPHTIITLDVRKAFDSVSHSAIASALQRMGIEEQLIRYIMKDLGSSTTRIKVGNMNTGAIKIQRGVKQGDPLSLVLFNLVVDELLDTLADSTDGATDSP